jgi:type VI protein secretion system component Hcp
MIVFLVVNGNKISFITIVFVNVLLSRVAREMPSEISETTPKTSTTKESLINTIPFDKDTKTIGNLKL